MSIILPGFNDLYEIAKNEILSKDTQLTDFNEGSVLDVHCGSSAAVGMELVYQIGQVLKSFYIVTATDSDLDARMKDYNIVRKPGYTANNTVTLTREKYTRNLMILAGTTFRCSADSIDYYNENDIVFNIGQLTATTILTALKPGDSSNILSNKIDLILPNPEEKITITHGPFINGINQETDDQLRERFYLEISNMARGTAPALRTGALRHTGVTNAAVQKIFSGYTKLYIDSGTGIPSDELIAEVQVDIDLNWKASGERVDVCRAETFEVEFLGHITLDPNYIGLTNTILAGAKLVVQNYLNSKVMGSAVYKSEIIRIVTSITGILDLELDLPANNIPGQPSKIIRAGVINFDIA